MKKFKRTAAIIGIVLILSMYIITAILAFLSKDIAPALFYTSAFCTIAIPIIIYGFIAVYKLAHKKDETDDTDNS